MSELPRIIKEPHVLSKEEYYRSYFGDIPVQATLNMLIAYQPQDHNPFQALYSENAAVLRPAMEAVYAAMLESAQRDGVVDLSSVSHEALVMVSDYLEDAKASLESRSEKHNTATRKVIQMSAWRSA